MQGFARDLQFNKDETITGRKMGNIIHYGTWGFTTLSRVILWLKSTWISTLVILYLFECGDLVPKMITTVYNCLFLILKYQKLLIFRHRTFYLPFLCFWSWGSCRRKLPWVWIHCNLLRPLLQPSFLHPLWLCMPCWWWFYYYFCLFLFSFFVLFYL